MNRNSLPFSVSCAAAAAALALSIAPARAQDWAKAELAKSPRHGEYVTINEANGRKLQAFVVYPEVSGNAPVVVMIHEIFGQSDWAKLMADELAAKGYIVVEPDLLSGFGAPAADSMAGMKMAPGEKMPEDHMHAAAPTGAAFVAATPGGTAAFPDQPSVTKAVSGLDPAIVTADLDAAADYGKKLPAASGKLAVAGFCWGGGKTFAFATHRKDLSAAFVFYGPPPPADSMAAINAPVYGFYAANDARIGATIPQATTDMKAAGKKYEPVTYAGAGHGFMRAGQAPDASADNKKAWDDGFARLLTLLKGMK
ncbi:dienelactone hydrolase family protein [Granulicella tundricola]|uniref:Carboxymethylenebutenolidase n=1 Tax=Granulicella tundricola (strain ATCC BAA-1859 / DSM 23138 / MP5ACTX9) TaxID=1198114 RepID=E8X0G3_GRATM|nr:dienelactone hydrolase family protein [Granulicella tundricola]ADW67827.1 carboxymethylenebutenolidase [Granulicella tundricola MP5ACTX9]